MAPQFRFGERVLITYLGRVATGTVRFYMADTDEYWVEFDTLQPNMYGVPSQDAFVASGTLSKIKEYTTNPPNSEQDMVSTSTYHVCYPVRKPLFNKTYWACETCDKDMLPPYGER